MGWETFFSFAVDSQSDTDRSSSGSFTENSVSDGRSRRTRPRVPRPPQKLSPFLKASYDDLMEFDLHQLCAAGEDVHTFLKGVIHSGQFRTWNEGSRWFDFGHQLLKVVKAKREDSDSIPPRDEGSWVAMSAEEYDTWDRSNRGVANQEYIAGLYMAAKPPVLFDQASTAGPDSRMMADSVSRYQGYQQDVERSNKLTEEADLSRYQEYQGIDRDRDIEFAYPCQHNNRALFSGDMYESDGEVV
ncbi:hypothetical protein BC827DRAFT_69509 [Russula dissimulans]|nr:hypothetical protein BC827DRAFT_69509 [Russula dissimulans]